MHTCLNANVIALLGEILQIIFCLLLSSTACRVTIFCSNENKLCTPSFASWNHKFEIVPPSNHL